MTAFNGRLVSKGVFVCAFTLGFLSPFTTSFISIYYQFITKRLNYRKLFTSRDPNTIFRGNSLTSKCIDETMKLAGMHYLQVTLKPIIDEVRTV